MLLIVRNACYVWNAMLIKAIKNSKHKLIESKCDTVHHNTAEMFRPKCRII